jgi:hypothetical protein
VAAGGVAVLLVVVLVVSYVMASGHSGSKAVAGVGRQTLATAAATTRRSTAATTEPASSGPSPSAVTSQSPSSTVASKAPPPSPRPQPPADLPHLPNRNTPLPVDANAPANPTDPTVISFRDSASTPSSVAELEEWRPTHLGMVGTRAIAAIERYMLAINAQDFDLAWRLSTYRLHGATPSSSFEDGYATSVFYQSAFGTPQRVSPRITVVPDRFVSRQNPAAQGYPHGVTRCSLWPQYVWLVVRLDGQWVPDVAGDFTNEPALRRFKRVGNDGNLYMSPVAERSSC